MKVFCLQLVLGFVGVLCQDAGFLNCPIISRIPKFSFQDLSALTVAAVINSTKDLETFLENGCDVNYNGTFWSEVKEECDDPLFTQLGVSCLRTENYEGYTALNLASRYSSLDVVKMLVQVPGIDLDGASTWPSSPVWSAASVGDVDKVRLLVTAGASLDFKGSQRGLPVLYVAVLSGSVQTVAFLIQRGVDVDEKSDELFSAAAAAAENGQLEILKLLREGGADLNIAQGKTNQSLLMFPARNNQTEVLDFLISEGVDVNAVQSDGISVLSFAAAAGNLDSVMSLVAAGADIDYQGSEKRTTALFEAIINNYTDVAMFLIMNGSIVDAITSDGFTDFYAAAQVSCEVRNFVTV